MYHLFVWSRTDGWKHMMSVKKAELASALIECVRTYQDVEIFAW